MMAKTQNGAKVGGGSAPQKGQDVPQHKRLAQGDPLPANKTGSGVKRNNA